MLVILVDDDNKKLNFHQFALHKNRYTESLIKTYMKIHQTSE